MVSALLPALINMSAGHRESVCPPHGTCRHATYGVVGEEGDEGFEDKLYDSVAFWRLIAAAWSICFISSVSGLAFQDNRTWSSVLYRLAVSLTAVPALLFCQWRVRSIKETKALEQWYRSDARTPPVG